MTMWDSSFGKSPLIKWLKQQVDILLAAAGFETIDITSKVDKPATFPTGNFVTFNTSTGNLEDTGVGETDFVASVSGKGLSENDFTDAYKAQLDGLDSEIDIGDKMDKITVTVANLNKLTMVAEGGNVAATEKAAEGVADCFTLNMPVPASYPVTYSVDTISTADSACRTAFIYATLGHPADLSQARASQFIVLLDNDEDPEVSEGPSAVKGDDFAAELVFSIVSEKLRVSYTVTTGAENPTYLKLTIIQQ